MAQTQVMVEKAALPFMEGEDLDGFVKSLKEPCLSHLAEKGLFSKDKDMAYPAQVFTDKIMVEVMRNVRGPMDDDSPYPEPVVYELQFKRDTGTGAYTFKGDPTEVERRTVYVPKVKAEVKKGFWGGIL